MENHTENQIEVHKDICMYVYIYTYIWRLVGNERMEKTWGNRYAVQVLVFGYVRVFGMGKKLESFFGDCTGVRLVA